MAITESTELKIKMKDLVKYFSKDLESLPIIGKTGNTITVGAYTIEKTNTGYVVKDRKQNYHEFSLRRWALAYSVKNHKNKSGTNLINCDVLYKRLKNECEYLESRLKKASGIKQSILESRLDRVEVDLDLLVSSVDNDIKTAFLS